MNILKSDIRSTLDLMGSTDKSDMLLEKCQVLCDKHDLSLHEFQQSLDAFLVSNSDTSFSLETIGKFEQQIMKENQKDRVQPGKSKNYLSDSPTSEFSMPGKRSFHMSTPDGSERPGTAIRTTKEASPGLFLLYILLLLLLLLLIPVFHLHLLSLALIFCCRKMENL
jgi:hypothetical protein